ncbi:MAG: ParM/StbA family protein [Anaerolineae bacterium]|nr:ParM/StbA family protein [Anaerolineae bacterium]
MQMGLDVGYSHTKAVSGERRAHFPSVVGTPDRARFSLGGNVDSIILTEPQTVAVGQGAVEQSRFLHRREDRRWIESPEWYALALAALTELSTAHWAELRIVAGLPVAFFDDRVLVRDRLLGEHRATREGRGGQVFKVIDVRVIPQPFGALLAACLDDRGRILDHDLATGRVGIVDVGGKTCNLLAVSRLSEISRETASVNAGAWDAVRGLRDFLAREYPDLDLRDHELVEAIQARELRYYGEPVDLGPVLDSILEPLAEQVIAQAGQLWNGAANLDAILIAGGGALLLGPYIARHYRHARTVTDPVFANAIGFWRFAERLANG